MSEASAITIRWSGQELMLLPEKALYWPGMRTLVATDPHFGKDAVFRAHGIPVPSGTTARDLERLTSVIDRWRPLQLLLLGDFFHARSARTVDTLEALAAWRRAHDALRIINVRGNHDRHAGDPPADLAISAAAEPLTIGPFQFGHHPEPVSPAPLIVGHIHPVFGLRGAQGRSARLPCFWLQERQLILPAFGGFTGGGKVQPNKGDRLFVVGDGEVHELAGKQ